MSIPWPRKSGTNSYWAQATDEQLLSAMSRHDTEAAAEFYDRHVEVLLGVADRLVGSGHVADSVVEDGLVWLWENAGRYQPEFGRPLSWMLTYLRKLALNRRR